VTLVKLRYGAVVSKGNNPVDAQGLAAAPANADSSGCPPSTFRAGGILL